MYSYMDKNINILILVQILMYKWLIYLTINCGNANPMVMFLKEISYKI